MNADGTTSAVIYDEEFTDTVDRALAERPGLPRGSSRGPTPTPTTSPWPSSSSSTAARSRSELQEKSKVILLTSGTTGTPKGAKHLRWRPRGAQSRSSIAPRGTPRNASVIVAPMFHAWGFSQLAFAASMACTIVTRRKFDPEATLELVDRHRAKGLCVVPVMFDRIMELPEDVLNVATTDAP